MINIFTVSFFGHRFVENYYNIETQLEDIIKNLLSTYEYVEFLVGRNGDFDQIVSSTIHRIKKYYRDDNLCHTLVLPYMTAEYRDNYDAYNEYYDDIDIYAESSNSHFKAAIQQRNRIMVDRSDLVIFYIENEFGGAYKTYQYSIKHNKRVIKLNIE